MVGEVVPGPCSLHEIHSRLDKLSEKMDSCLNAVLSLKASDLPPPGPVKKNSINISTLKIPNDPHVTPNSLAVRNTVTSQATFVEDDGRPQRVRNSVRATVTSSTCGVSRMSSRPSLRFNEFGESEAVSRHELVRRVAQHRRSGRLHGSSRSSTSHADVAKWLAEHSCLDEVWILLDDPHSSWTAWWIALVLRILVVASIVVPILQVLEEQPMLPWQTEAVLGTAIDTIFLIEFVFRLMSAPSKKTFLLDFYNWADAISALGLPLRASTDFASNTLAPHEQGVAQILLHFMLPMVRALKLLRYIESFRLLVDAVTNSRESLPVLLYTMALMVLASASATYLAEPRANIPTLSHSIWLAVVTMTSLGYGDYSPITPGGRLIGSALTVTSMLFVAMPVGLIGYEFTLCWQNRTRVLLLARARKRFAQWGFRGHDVRRLFEYADVDKDGALNLMEFCELLGELKLGLSTDNIVDLFQVFDQDVDGLIESFEFVETLFPDGSIQSPSDPSPAGSVSLGQVAPHDQSVVPSWGGIGRGSVLNLPDIEE